MAEVGVAAAIMIVITSATSATPVPQDETHVIASTYPTLEACRADLALTQFAGKEADIERQFGLRVLRACMPAAGQFWYGWLDGKVTGDAGVVVQAGPVKDR